MRTGIIESKLESESIFVLYFGCKTTDHNNMNIMRKFGNKKFLKLFHLNSNLEIKQNKD
jgi:hypothetical protein